MLLTGETQDGSPVEFEDLPANGVYNVVVFPLTENGIVGLLLPSRNKSLLTPQSLLSLPLVLLFPLLLMSPLLVLPAPVLLVSFKALSI